MFVPRGGWFIGVWKQLGLFALVAVAGRADAAEWNTPESRGRWAEVSAAVFGTGEPIAGTDHLVTIEAPATAQDATLVPVTLGVASETPVKELSLVIDQNPVPLAATVRFGPAGNARRFKLRVRVDGFTNMHAVATTADARLVQSAVFVKGAGGCSAPMTMSVAEASAGMGEMKMKFETNAALGDAPQATLMIRHPNFNGMQKDPATKSYTAARFIRSISVSRGTQTVFAMTSDISLSTNPVVAFIYRPEGTEPLRVTAVDTAGMTWTQEFAIPQTLN